MEYVTVKDLRDALAKEPDDLLVTIDGKSISRHHVKHGMSRTLNLSKPREGIDRFREFIDPARG